MMFLNSSGIYTCILSQLESKKLANFLSRKSIQTFFSWVWSQLVTSLIILFCWVHVFEHVHPFASLLVKSQTKFTSKSRNKQTTRTLKWQEMIERKSELLTPHPWCNMGRKRKCRSVLCGLMNICCVILTENFGLNQAVLSPLVVI